MLGSVTFSPTGGPDSGHAVRTSARVIQKMRMDTARPPTPPPPEKKDKSKEEAVVPKPTPPPPRINRPVWSNMERNIFFEALNEYGRDFDAITHFMNHKLKRKQPLEQPMYKMVQVRQLYYQTFHKISKYLKFSDGKSNFFPPFPSTIFSRFFVLLRREFVPEDVLCAEKQRRCSHAREKWRECTSMCSCATLDN